MLSWFHNNMEKSWLTATYINTSTLKVWLNWYFKAEKKFQLFLENVLSYYTMILTFNFVPSFDG